MDTNECSLCRPGGFALTRQMFQFAGIEIPEDKFKSNVRETWRVILVSKAGIFLSESLRMRSKSIQGVFLLHLFRNDCKII